MSPVFAPATLPTTRPTFFPSLGGPAWGGPYHAVTLGTPDTARLMPLGDGDVGTMQTIDQIRQLVDQGKKDPEINRLALFIVRNVRPFDFATERRLLYEWVRKNIRFRKDVAGVETLRTAREIIRVGGGDCDDINAILLPSLLATIGHQTRLVTISAHPLAPETFTHIYAEVLEGGRWIPIDAARRDPRFGRGPERFFRKRYWSLNNGQYTDVRGLGFYTNALGFDWGTFGTAVSSVSAGVSNVVTAIRAPSSYLRPAPAGAPPEQIQYQQSTPSQIPPWVFVVGLGFLGLLFLRRS